MCLLSGQSVLLAVTGLFSATLLTDLSAVGVIGAELSAS